LVITRFVNNLPLFFTHIFRVNFHGINCFFLIFRRFCKLLIHKRLRKNKNLIKPFGKEKGLKNKYIPEPMNNRKDTEAFNSWSADIICQILAQLPCSLKLKMRLVSKQFRTCLDCNFACWNLNSSNFIFNPTLKTLFKFAKIAECFPTEKSQLIQVSKPLAKVEYKISPVVIWKG
jgi:hypothetical protein